MATKQILLQILTGISQSLVQKIVSNKSKVYKNRKKIGTPKSTIYGIYEEQKVSTIFQGCGRPFKVDFDRTFCYYFLAYVCDFY